MEVNIQRRGIVKAFNTEVFFVVPFKIHFGIKAPDLVEHDVDARLLADE
jgi:hypothetical protein